DQDYDVAVVVSFRYFLPKELIRFFPHGAFNVHPSLLPRYRGAAPLQHTILNRDKEAGVSIMDLDEEKFDAGRILHQTRIVNAFFYFLVFFFLVFLSSSSCFVLVLTLSFFSFHRDSAMACISNIFMIDLRCSS
ncbi:formyl transferase, partial [Chytridium lagenaria]